MNAFEKFNNYPLWIVMLSNLVSFSIYGLGFLILLQTGWIISILYLLYILILEYRVIRYHCVNCYYWGKTCGFGKGRISFLLFKKGEASKFCANVMTWKDMIPDLLITLIPFVAGIVLIIIKFNIFLLLSLILLMVLSTSGNAFIRGKLACKYCAQRELGCPAEKLFNKNIG